MAQPSSQPSTRASAYERMRVWDEDGSPEGPATLRFDADEFAIPQLGFIVENVGWTQFFVICTLLAIPGMLMLFIVAPWGVEDETPDEEALGEEAAAEEEARL